MAPRPSAAIAVPGRRESLVFAPPHCLALIENKTHALDQAARLADRDMPEAFTTLRRLPKARLAGQRARANCRLQGHESRRSVPLALARTAHSPDGHEYSVARSAMPE